MKMTEEVARRICRTVLARWKEKRLVRPKTGEDVLLAKMMGEILADARREEALDREVEEILDRHARELSVTQANSRLLFQKIKERLARERNIVL